MPYPILAPTLAAMTATKNDPDNSEAANQLGAVDRQTRNWLVDYLGQYFEDGKGLKAAAYNTADGLPTSFIKGTNPVDGQPRHLAAGTVRAEDIANLAITSAKLDEQAVTESKIAMYAVTNTRLADGAVTATKLGTNSVTKEKLGLNAVQGSAIASEGIIAGKYAPGSIHAVDIGQRQVDGRHLPVCPAGYILVGGNTVELPDGSKFMDAAVPKKLSGALGIDAEGVVSIITGVGGNAVTIAEVAGPKINGGVAASGWNTRGIKVPWSLVQGDPNLVDLKVTSYDGGIAVTQPGIYLVMGSFPAYGVNNHKARLTLYEFTGAVQPNIPPGGTTADDNATVKSALTIIGTTEYAASGVTIQTRSLIHGILSVGAAPIAASVFCPRIYINHYCALASTSSNALGRGFDSDADNTPEYFGVINLVRLS